MFFIYRYLILKINMECIYVFVKGWGENNLKKGVNYEKWYIIIKDYEKF